MARLLSVEPRWKFEDLKKAIGQEFHIAQPSGNFIPAAES